MARMQKKKPGEKKKKTRRTDGSEAGGTGGNSASLSDATAGQGPGLEVKQKKQKSGSASGSGAGGMEQTAVVRFLNRYFGDWIQFLREVKVELSKVTWPSRKETVGTTAVVLVFVIIVAIFLGAVDFVLSSLVRLIL